jgi:hypothetical protein
VGEQDSNLHGAFTVMYNCRFHFWVILVHHPKKSGLILMTFIIALTTCCITAGMPASYITSQSPMWGNLSNKFLIALVSSSLVSAAHDPYQKFNPITKEACFTEACLQFTLSLKGLSLTGYLCEFVCTSGYLPPLIGIHRSVLYAFTL